MDYVRHGEIQGRYLVLPLYFTISDIVHTKYQNNLFFWIFDQNKIVILAFFETGNLNKNRLLFIKTQHFSFLVFRLSKEKNNANDKSWSPYACANYELQIHNPNFKTLRFYNIFLAPKNTSYA